MAPFDGLFPPAFAVLPVLAVTVPVGAQTAARLVPNATAARRRVTNHASRRDHQPLGQCGGAVRTFCYRRLALPAGRHARCWAHSAACRR